MSLSSILIAIIFVLGATGFCVMLFQRLGFGSVLAFIVAGMVIGPNTPGPVASTHVEELQSVAEIGVVLFLFTVGLEMRPERLWSMRRLLFGLGSAQVLLTATAVGAYIFAFVANVAWEGAVVAGLGFAMSSTAIVMATMSERAEMDSELGGTSFAILMAQDLWIVPVMALVPILAHTSAQAATVPWWEQLLLVAGVIAGIFVVGRYLLPAVLGYAAKRRRMDAFGIVLFLAVIASAWAVDTAGISMTLGAFFIGMMLSGSDFRYQIEATVAPFKGTLMGLFFIAVGMSIDVGALLRDWSTLVVMVPVIMLIKLAVLVLLALAFGIGRSAAIRTGFYLSQVGEFAFVLFGAAAAAGVLSPNGLTLGMLIVAVSMILTPLLVKAGDQLAIRLRAQPASVDAKPAADLERHVVVIGYDEVGQLISLMLDRANIPSLAFDYDIEVVRRGKRAGRNVHFGDMFSAVTQEAAGLGKASAVYVALTDMEAAKGLAITLHRLYPGLNIYVRVRTTDDQEEMAKKGIKHAGTGYIESTLVRGSMLLKDLGVTEDEVAGQVKALQADDYAVLRANRAELAMAASGYSETQPA